MSAAPDDYTQLELQTRRILAETLKLEAENRKLDAENHKLLSEQRKLDLEADALHRWRYIALPVGIASLSGALSAGLVAVLLAFLKAG